MWDDFDQKTVANILQAFRHHVATAVATEREEFAKVAAEKRRAYTQALNVVDAVFSEKTWGPTKLKPTRSTGGSVPEVRAALNELLLVAPSAIVVAFMRCAMSTGNVEMLMLNELRALMRKDIGLDTLVYSDTDATWLVSRAP